MLNFTEIMIIKIIKHCSSNEEKKVSVQKENNSSPKIKRKTLQNSTKEKPPSQGFIFTKFRGTKNQKKENQLYLDADISSSENSIQNEGLQTQKFQNRPRDNSYRSPIIKKNNSLDPSKRNLRKTY